MGSSSRRKMTPEERLARFGFKSLPEIPQDRLVLPVGFMDEDMLYTHARVRSMTGEDRRVCANSKNQKSAAHMETALLKQCVTELSNEDEKSVTKPNVSMLRKMTEADRSFLSMHIRWQSYPGQDMIVESVCDNPECREKITYHVTFEEIEIINVKPEWRGDVACFSFKDEETNCNAVMHYMTGADQELLVQRFGKVPRRKVNMIEVMQASAEVMIEEINGEEVDEEDLLVFPQNLNSLLEEESVKHRAGPDLTPMAHCPGCGHETTLGVNVVDFLLRGRQGKGSNP